MVESRKRRNEGRGIDVARIRTVKPTFWTHPVMGRLPDLEKWLAVALLNLADDEGYFLADASIVRGAVAPFEEDSSRIRVALERLVQVGWIATQSHDELGPIGFVVKLTKHQKIDKPTPSKLKRYWQFDESSASPRQPLGEPSPTDWKGSEGSEEMEMEGNHSPVAAAPGLAAASRPRKLVTEQDGLIGDLARSWAARHPELETPTWGSEAAAVNKLAGRHGVDAVRAAFDVYLADDFVGNDGHPLKGFVARIDTYRARAAQSQDPLSNLSPAGRKTAAAGRRWLAEQEAKDG